jgi:hypothetical protein
MTDLTFDTLTRQTGLTMPGALSPATFAAPVVAKAKGRKRENRGKKRKRCKTGCKSQTESCRTFLAPACAGSPRCPALIECCESLGSCDAAEFITCLLDVIGGA